MAKPTFIDIPHLPDDILRIIFEKAAMDDARKAVKYTLISKRVCAWYVVKYLFLSGC
jgi:hypothetical protein